MTEILRLDAVHRLRGLRTGSIAWRLAPLVCALGLLLAAPSSAHAYAWMIRHGENQCVNCHADPSGAGLLTRYGRSSGQDLLRMPWGSDRGSSQDPAGKAAGPKRTGFLWGLWDTPSWLLLGGSLRFAGVAQHAPRVFPMQLDLYGQVKFGRFRAGGSFGVAKVEQNSSNARSAFVTANQGDSLNLISRTHWLALDLGRHNDWTLRAGRLNLPFGLRIPDHTMWTRELSRTDTESDQQHGAAVAYNRGAIRSEVMGIAGNYQIRPDRYRERGYSGFAEYAFTDGLAAGVSSLVTEARADRVTLQQLKTIRGVHGAFARARIVKPLVVLAEADFMHSSRRSAGYVGFVQFDYEPIRGLHAMATVEVMDRGSPDVPAGATAIPSVGGEGQVRPGGWLTVDWFFYSQLELRVDVVAREGSGYALAQLHAYL